MTETTTGFVYDDGGRAAAGFKGSTGDCVVRAIAIAAERPYREVYDLVNDIGKRSPEHRLIRSRGRVRYQARSTARGGVLKKDTRTIMQMLGWKWTPTMRIGSGCKVHLRADELPRDRIIAQLSGHVCAVVNGVVHDLYDCSREGTRCVYGYYSKEPK
jgi:hypothetical protein